MVRFIIRTAVRLRALIALIVITLLRIPVLLLLGVFYALRVLRLLGFWGVVTLIIVFSVSGAIASALIRAAGVGTLATAIAGNIIGLVAVALYLRYWRNRYQRDFGVSG